MAADCKWFTDLVPVFHVTIEKSTRSQVHCNKFGRAAPTAVFLSVTVASNQCAYKDGQNL